MIERHGEGHALWVRLCHWVAAASVITLAFTGVVILMAHPRLYWGEVGNDLTPALLDLPISRNYRHVGWAPQVPFFDAAGSPVSAVRTFDLFNQNGWGRSLHFLAGWLLFIVGLFYLAGGLLTRHFSERLVPRAEQLTMRAIRDDLRAHVRTRVARAPGASHYGTLQRIAYTAVVFVALPFMLLSGLSLSPALTAAIPWLAWPFGGFQSARTLHFVVFLGLLLFLIGHVVMVARSGFRQQMRAMTIGGSHEDSPRHTA